MSIATLIIGIVSAVAALASSVIAFFAYRRSRSADSSSVEILKTMRDANNLAAREDKRQEINEGARPWVITFDKGSTYRARNNLNVPMFDVDIVPLEGDVAFSSNGTPRDIVQDGESFTFLCVAKIQVRITYHLRDENEERHFDDVLPSKSL